MEMKDAIKNRRSFYEISKNSPIEDDKIIELIHFATKYTPSAFHSQCQMTAILFGEKHDQLWNIVLETLQKVVPPAGFENTQAKVKAFQSGYGTILYFNDENITKSLQEKNPLYADNFPIWAQQANGMLQIAVWSLLESEGFGASLQHYNPLIDHMVQEAFDIPKNWKLIAQMPFGMPTTQPGTKEFSPIEMRVKIIK